MDDNKQFTDAPGGDSTPQQQRPEKFQLHIPEEALQYGDESPEMQSFSGQGSASQAPSEEKQSRGQRRLEKKQAKAREKVKGRKNRGLFRCVWISMVILVSIALSRYLLVGVNDMLAVSRTEGTASVELSEDPTMEQVSQTLTEAGVISNPEFFSLYCMVTGADDGFGQGSYEIDTNMDYEAIVNFLQNNNNRQDVVNITFPEGLNLREFAERLEENEVCTVEEVLEAANSDLFDDYDFINAIDNEDERYYKLEGYLFPDTYDFYKGEDPDIALGKMINNCQNRFSKEMRDRATEMGYTIDEILTLASIVQAEANGEDDMGMVAGILLNRLDSTTFYPYRSQSQVPEEERETYVSRYDTYTIEGLPPGPICNPGLQAINAVLWPSEDSEGMYYFCHDADGNAYYASTWSEHQQHLEEAGLLD